jgi:DNA-binding transcriptional MerR regulator/methylmalonyl-CoA mutase cobalamin-binding subunit
MLSSMTADPGSEASRPRHSIAVVVGRTGLTQDVLRMWERRYAAVVPGRSAAGERLYSDDDVQRLRLLAAAVAAGRRVGGIAQLPTAELAQLVEDDRAESSRRGPPARREPERGQAIVDTALAHVRAMDARGLHALLRGSAAVLGASYLDQVAAPLLRRIGEEWHGGRLSIAAEHIASAVIEATVTDAMRAIVPDDTAPSVVVATLAGSQHLIAAALVGASAAAEGWNVVYLGGELPASEIAAVARSRGARAVAVSIPYSGSSKRLLDDLRDLRAKLPADVPLFAGGQAVLDASRSLAASGIELGADLDELRAAMRRIWTRES